MIRTTRLFGGRVGGRMPERVKVGWGRLATAGTTAVDGEGAGTTAATGIEAG